jgi:hypothetical protein
MERKFYTDDFEQLLKEQSDEFRMYPSKRVWHSIYNDLHPGRKWPSVAVSMFLIIALLMMGYWNSNSNDDTATFLKIAPVAVATQNTGTNTAENFPVKAGADSYISPDALNNAGSSKTTTTAKESNKYPVAIDIKSNSARLLNNTTNTIQKEKNTNSNAVVKNEVVKELATTITDDSKTMIVVTAPVSDNETETSSLSPGADDNNSNGIAGQKNNAVALTSNNSIATRVKTSLSDQDKAWIEDFAFHNKSKRKPWKDRTTLDFYLTPNVTYRKLSNESKYNLPSPANSFTASAASAYANSAVDQKPGLGLEAGFGLTYAVGKNFRIKAGIQANYTNYGVNADETNHPVLTTLMFIDPNSGYPYLSSSSSTLSNSSGLQPVRMHNKTYQLSVPLGMAFKIMGNDKLEFYAGASLQPTFVLGGKANLISADRKNYVADPSLIRQWNVNTGLETYINYKLDGFTLQAGPQFRYQLFSTYDKKYTVNENLYGMGLKVGILKNF